MPLNGYERAQREYDNMLPEFIEESEEPCPYCGMIECECTYCKDCKTVNGCSCDEQYQAWKDNQLG